jgi:hypothetical protein
MNTSFTWSYSRLKNYETCPKRHYHYDIAKDILEPETAQVSEGHIAHKAFEERIAKGTKLPLPLLQHEHLMKKLSSMPGKVYAEQRLALTRDFKPVDFFGKDVWFRTVIDFCAVQHPVAAVIDYKTGKPAKDNTQLALMAATVMHYDYDVELVRSVFLFVNHNQSERVEFTRGAIPTIWSNVLPRVAELQMAVESQEFPPKPGGLCKRYCGVLSCPYHGRGSQ